MTPLEQATKELETVQEALGALVRLRDQKIAEIEAKYAPAFTELQEQRRACVEKVNQAKFAAAKAEYESPTAKLKPGDKVWFRKYFSPGRIDGVIEMFGPGTVFPSNVRYYSLPNVGELFIRHLNKNGMPGRAFTKLRVPGQWHREFSPEIKSEDHRVQAAIDATIEEVKKGVPK